MEKKIFSSGSPWEDIVGYSRAVRCDHVIEVSGTTAVDGNNVIGVNDYYQQTFYILETIKSVLEQAGSNMDSVVRTRMYVCDISKWEEVAKAHAAFFKNIKPATTMVEVSRLIDERLLVEIEATAIVQLGK